MSFRISPKDIPAAMDAAWKIYEKHGYALTFSAFQDVLSQHFFDRKIADCLAQNEDLKFNKQVGLYQLNQNLKSADPETDLLAGKIRNIFTNHSTMEGGIDTAVHGVKKGTPLQWYGKLHPASKYHGQFRGVAPVYFSPEPDGFCVKTDLNQYRLCDMMFYRQSLCDEKFYEEINILGDTVALLQRLLADLQKDVDKQRGGSFSDRGNLYVFSQHKIFALMTEIVKALPSEEPRCPVCKSTIHHCQCLR